MTISYLLAPNPKWYIADLTGRPLGGGTMYTYRSMDKTEKKFIFQDPAGNFPWTDPVLFDENGSQGPFYWEVDGDNLQETYYIEVYDSANVLQWTIDNFAPPGGGGGSIITTALDLENLIVNNVMWRNLGSSTSPLPVFIRLAPGAHSALVETPARAGGDIIFIKNNTNATDQIIFTPFVLGSTPLTGDVTPVDYLKYVCTNTPTGETQKVVQYPITAKVQNLTNQEVTFTIWARSNSGGNTLDISVRQFFGDGSGASPDVIHPIQTITLTSSWQKFTLNDTIPSVTGKVLGACGNDALFIHVGLPLDSACDIDFTKPSLYLGNISPDQEYHTYDMIDGVINAPRTGDVKTSYVPCLAPNNFTPPGYLYMDDGTIGSASSGATSRANIDTFPLYNLLWNNVTDTYAPVSGGRGVSAISDFTANKPIALTKQLGRMIGNTGQGAGLSDRVLGQYLGEETHVLTISEMPAHTHNVASGPTPNVVPAGGSHPQGDTNTVVSSSTGGDGAHNNMPPVVFQNVYIKL